MVFIGNLPLFCWAGVTWAGGASSCRTVVAVAAYALFIDLILLVPFFPKKGLTMTWC